MTFEYPKPPSWYIVMFQDFDRVMMHIPFHMYCVLAPLLFMIFLFFLLVIVIGIFRPTKRWITKHHILGMNAGDAIFNIVSSIFDWFLIPILDKIVFLFTPTIYKAKVLSGVKEEVNENYKKTLSDYQRQVLLITEDRDTWRRAYETEKHNTEKSYWDGAKHGYSLGEKQKSKSKKKNKTLTEAHFFTLQQIANGNKTVGGLAGAYLEEHGYISIVWEDEEHKNYHYELTKKGSNTINPQ